MTLKYNKFKCYWAAFTEKKTSNSVYREGQKIAEKILFFVIFYLVYVL